MWSKMVMANQILRFLNELYLKSNRVNQLHFLHADIDSRIVKGGSVKKGMAWSKKVSVNQILQFLYQLYRKSNWIMQGVINVHADKE